MDPEIIKKACALAKLAYVSHRFHLSGGHNDTYFVKTTTDEVVFRSSRDIYPTIQAELHALEQANGLGPKVLSHGTNWLLETKVKGEHPTEVTKEFLHNMGIWYARLHSISTTKIPHTKNSNTYSLLIAYEARVVPQKEPFFSPYHEWFSSHDDLFKNRKRFPLTQGDPTRENIFIKEGKITLIDWEFAAYDIAERDLAFFVDHYSLTSEQQAFFLHSYGYTHTTEEFKAATLLHYLSMIAWQYERIELIESGKQPEYRHWTKQKLQEGIEHYKKKITTLPDLV